MTEHVRNPELRLSTMDPATRKSAAHVGRRRGERAPEHGQGQDRLASDAVVSGRQGSRQGRSKMLPLMQAAHPDTESATYWDIDDIQFHCRVGRTTAWRLVKLADFPAPVVIGPKGLVWPRSEVIGFMEARRSEYHYRPPRPEVAPIQSRPSAPYTTRPVTTRRRLR